MEMVNVAVPDFLQWLDTISNLPTTDDGRKSVNTLVFVPSRVREGNLRFRADADPS
jgi:hypothetical protein